MNYQHRFVVNAPLTTVTEFHRQSASMGAITPPPIIVRIHDAPSLLNDGDEMAFTLWLGPLPISWRARIEVLPGGGFIDRQISGPFAKWEHRHMFEPIHKAQVTSKEQIQEESTVVIDEVNAELSNNWFWKLVGGGMWLTLPLLFAFRGWKSRRLLEGAPTGSANPAATSSL